MFGPNWPRTVLRLGRVGEREVAPAPLHERVRGDQGWKIFEMGSELFVLDFRLPRFRSKNKA